MWNHVIPALKQDIILYAVIFCPKLLSDILSFVIFSLRNSDSQTISGWKPYGTPIVSLISCDDAVTRGDIQVIVNRMLSPLLRKGGNVEQATTSETSIPKATPDQCSETASGDACAANMVSNSLNKDGTDSKAPSIPTLPLLLVDESNACIDLSMGEEKVVKLSPSSATVLVYIDWSLKLLEKYDTHPLENLPEVLKYGPVTKKARTEPLSLYTCLEAFLREEPLVPEDMWLVPPTTLLSHLQHSLHTFSFSGLANIQKAYALIIVCLIRS